MIGLLLALSGPPATPAPWFGSAGRVFTSPAIHVGVRPAVFLAPHEFDVGATLQVSLFIF